MVEEEVEGVDDISNSPPNYVFFFLLLACASLRWSSVVAREEDGVDLLVVLASRILKTPAVFSGKFWRAVAVFYISFLYCLCYQAHACTHTHIHATHPALQSEALRRAVWN